MTNFMRCHKQTKSPMRDQERVGDRPALYLLKISYLHKKDKLIDHTNYIFYVVSLSNKKSQMRSRACLRYVRITTDKCGRTDKCVDSGADY